MTRQPDELAPPSEGRSGVAAAQRTLGVGWRPGSPAATLTPGS